MSVTRKPNKAQLEKAETEKASKEIALCGFDVTNLRTGLQRSSAMSREEWAEKQGANCVAFPDLLGHTVMAIRILDEHAVVQEDSPADVHRVWGDLVLNSDLQIMECALSTVTLDRLFIEDCHMVVKFMVTRGVIEDGSVYEKDVNKVNNASDEPTRLAAKRALIEKLWNKRDFALSRWPALLEIATIEPMRFPPADHQHFLSILSSDFASAPPEKASSDLRHLYHRIIHSPWLWSEEFLRRPMCKQWTRVIVISLGEVEGDSDPLEWAQKVQNEARDIFYDEASASIMASLSGAELRSAYYVSGARAYFGPVPATPRKQLLCIVSAMYLGPRRIRAKDVLRILAYTDFDNQDLAVPTTLEELQFLQEPLPDAPQGHRLFDPRAVAKVSAVLTQLDPTPAVQASSSSSAPPVEQHQVSISQLAEGGVKVKPSRPSGGVVAGSVLDKQQKKKEKAEAEKAKKAAAAATKAAQIAAKGINIKKRKATEALSEHEDEIDDSDEEDDDDDASAADEESHEGQGGQQSAVDMSVMFGDAAEGPLDVTDLNFGVDESDDVANISAFLDAFDSSLSPLAEPGQKARRMYQPTEASQLQVGSYIALLRNNEGPIFHPPAGVRPTFDIIGNLVRAGLFRVTAVEDEHVVVAITHTLKAPLNRHFPIGPLIIARPQTLFLAPSVLMSTQLKLEPVHATSVSGAGGRGGTSSTDSKKGAGGPPKSSNSTKGQSGGESKNKDNTKKRTCLQSEFDDTGICGSDVLVAPVVGGGSLGSGGGMSYTSLPSRSILTSHIGVEFNVTKNENAFNVVWESQCMSAYMTKARLNKIMGSSDCTLAINAPFIRKGLDYVFHEGPGRSKAQSCHVWGLAVFIMGDVRMEEKAFFMNWDQYRNLSATSLRLRHFLPGRLSITEIKTFPDLRLALEGLESVFDLVYDMPHMFQSLVDAIRDNTIQRFDLEYVVMEIHASLCQLRAVSERIHPLHNPKKDPAVYEQLFRDEFATIATRLSKDGQEDFLDCCKAALAFRTEIVSPDLTPTGDKKSNTPKDEERRNRGYKGELCIADLRHECKALKRGGGVFDPCGFGSKCKRTHMSEAHSISKADALAQISKVVADKTIAQSCVSWVEKQSSFK